MSDSKLNKFMVLFLIPKATMDEWQNTDAAEREVSEKKMMQEWTDWNQDHAAMILSHEVGGKTKCVMASGVSDLRNDIVICSTVQGESHEAVANAYANHPHLQVPHASIQVMAVLPLNGM